MGFLLFIPRPVDYSTRPTLCQILDILEYPWFIEMLHLNIGLEVYNGSHCALRKLPFESGDFDIERMNTIYISN